MSARIDGIFSWFFVVYVCGVEGEGVSRLKDGLLDTSPVLVGTYTKNSLIWRNFYTRIYVFKAMYLTAPALCTYPLNKTTRGN